MEGYDKIGEDTGESEGRRENRKGNGRILERLGRTRTMAPELSDFSFSSTVSHLTCDIPTLGCFCPVMDQRNALKGYTESQSFKNQLSSQSCGRHLDRPASTSPSWSSLSLSSKSVTPICVKFYHTLLSACPDSGESQRHFLT